MIILTGFWTLSTTDGKVNEVGGEGGDADVVDGVRETPLSKLQSNIDSPFNEGEDNVSVVRVPVGEEGGNC
jgi:hypothetical protein